MPQALTEAELGTCINLVARGEAVGREYVSALLPDAAALAVVHTGNQIVGVGAIKQVRPDYARGVARKSGAEFDPATPELGYVAVDPAHGHRGLSGRIVAALIAEQKGPLFATTDSDYMKSSLQKAGFNAKGREWDGQRGKLSLWMRETPANHPTGGDPTEDTKKIGIGEKAAALKAKTSDEFSSSAVEGAVRALGDTDNPMRLNFFSTAMRILFEHMMDTLSPEDQVARASWFKPERENGKPSRRQRVNFAIRSWLSDTFLDEDLKIDIAPLSKRLLNAVDDLSKHVHGREETIIRDRQKQEAAAEVMIGAMGEFLDAIRECREAVLGPIAAALDEATVNAFLTETIMEVDELAPHHSVDELYVEEVSVSSIGPDVITYRVAGAIDVTLQWGSNSDVRRGDGAEASKTFPFECEFRVPLDNPWDLDRAELTHGVDTSAWRAMMSPHEWE